MAPFDEDGKVIWRKWVEIACDLMMELAESKELQPENSSTFKEKNKNSYGISEKMVAAVAGKVGTLLQLQSRPAEGSLVGAKYVATFKDPGETRDSPESDEPDTPIEPISPSARGIRRSMSRRVSSAPGTPTSPTRVSSAGSEAIANIGTEAMPQVVAYSEALYRAGRKVPVLSEEGVCLARNLQPVSSMNAVSELAQHHVVIEIKRAGDDMADNAEIAVFNVNLNEIYRTMKRLPVLAKVDFEMAESWAQQMAYKLSVEQNDKGVRGISFKTPMNPLVKAKKEDGADQES
jgi:hypothetical protein